MNNGKYLLMAGATMLVAATAGAAPGIGGYCSAIEASGTNAYLGAGRILLAFDVSDPAAPVCIDSLHLPDQIEQIAVEGDRLYAACGAAGMHQVDISDPASIAVLGTYDSPGHAYGVAVEGAKIYLADGVGGLRVLDAASLAPINHFPSAGPAMDVLVSGTTLYLLDHFNGVNRLDAALSQTGLCDAIGFGQRLAFDGTTLYVADGHGAVSQINAGTMALTARSRLGPPTTGLAVFGSDLFVASGDAGVRVAGGAVINTPGCASDVSIDGDRLYVADGFGGMEIFDAAAKSLLGSWSFVARSRNAAVADGRAYIAAGNEGVKIYDVADPARPAFIATASSASNAHDVAVANGLLLVADSLFGLEIIDISNPAAPAHAGRYALPSPGIVRCVGAAGAFAYISDGHNVWKVNVALPAAPAVEATYVSDDYIAGIEARGTNVLLATGRNGLVVLSDNLDVAGRLLLPGATLSLSAEGEQAYSAGDSVWSRIDLSNPLTPVAVTNFAPLVRALQIEVSGGSLYASADDGGTAILPLPGTDGDTDGDGLEDALEQQIIAVDPNDAYDSLASVRPEDDFDGDGLSNLHEQLAGTSPVDPSSVFAICGLEKQPGEGGFAVSWYSCAGRTYTVRKSTNLVEGFHILQSGIPANAPINTHADPAAEGCAMYLITVDP